MMWRKPAGSHTGINRIGQALELHSFFLKHADEIDQLLHTSAQPIQLPDHKSISSPKGSRA